MPKFILDLLALPPQGSTASRGIDALHVFVISFTMIASFAVAAVAIFFIARYRRTSDTQLTPRIVATWKSEVAVLVAIFTLFLVWWVIGYVQYVAIEEPPPGAMVVYVQAKQWMWKFTYPDGRGANDVLTVPSGRPVKLVMTSRDMIHSFYVPGFRLKQDVLPGRYVTMWFEATAPGNYPIYCAEYCGVSHSGMLGTVHVLSPEDYAAWLASTTRDLSGENDLVATGERVAVKRQCLACHSVDGQPHVGPTWRGLYGSTVTMTDGHTVIADEAYLTRSMMEPNADLVAGYKAVMPAYFGVLEQPEVGALVAYIKSLKDAPAGTSGVRLPPTLSPEQTR